MGLISVTNSADGETADAADLNNPINTIVNEFNGKIDNANVKSSAGIGTSKLSQDGTAQLNPSILLSPNTFIVDNVASGCVITATAAGSTLAWSMTSGTVFIGGKYLTVASASGSVTASKDTYFDLLDPGAGTIATLVNTGGNIVTNGAAAPALAANSVRIGIVVSGASSIASASSITQFGSDSLSNLIYPQRAGKLTVLRQDDTTNTLKKQSTMLSGWGVITGNGTGALTETVTFGVTFTQRPIVVAVFGGDNASAATTYGSGIVGVNNGFAEAHTITTTSFIIRVLSQSGTWSSGNTVFYQWFAIGEVV